MTTAAEHRQPWQLSTRAQAWFDVALATTLTLPALATPFTAAGWVGLVVSVGQVVPLYLRRRHPVAVFAAVAVFSAVQVLVVDTPLWSQIAFPVAVYSVARFASTRPGLIALGVGLCASVVAAVRWTVGFNAQFIGRTVTSYVVTIATIVVTAWALGTLGRVRRAYVDALVDRGEQIQREAAQEIALAASQERARIAREMHDVVAHGLSMIVVQADGARYAAREIPAVATDALVTISETGREALDEMRRLLGLLRSDDGTELRPQPGLADLDELVAETRTAGTRVDARLPEPRTHVPDGVALTTYRVLQEALTNVRKHAGPDVTVRVEVAVDDGIRIVVEDDGRGAAAADDGRGLGLAGMRERVTAHGGGVEAGPRPGGGFRVAARLPR